MQSFAEGLISRYTHEVDDVNGVINMKKNNCFIAELGTEFMFYSAFVRSFDSSFGNVLEKMGNSIAKLSYEVRGNISSFILPYQTQRIASILDNYVDYVITPSVEHYDLYTSIYPTQKPLAVLEKIIKIASNEGDLVLDCFNGVGSTGEAALKSNRRYLGIEIEKDYVEATQRRLEKYKIQKYENYGTI